MAIRETTDEQGQIDLDVSCDTPGCGGLARVPGNHPGNWGPDKIEFTMVALIKAGWSVMDDGACLCPACAEK